MAPVTRPLASLFALVPAAQLLAAPVHAAEDPVAAIHRREARYAPVDLKADLSTLPASERLALARLVEAAREMDGLFLRQVWSGNPALLLALASDRSPLGRARLGYFLRNKGPWDRLDGEPFMPGVPAKPAGGTFYPVDAGKAELDAFLAGLASAERALALGFYTVIRRAPDGRFTMVPYAVAYQPELGRAAALLRQAAAATADEKLRAFLESRAGAFLSNDYLDSEVAWMRLDGAIEPTIGPYEVYEDGLYNAKAAFEAFIGVRDEAETAKLARFSAELQGIEDALPIDPAWKNPHLPAAAPIRVVNELYASGDAARGVTTAAYNLPNDERVVTQMGSKRVMLRNVQQAKFEKVLLPIAARALAPEDRRRIAFEPFFIHILMHELVHGLGPHQIRVGDRATTVRAELADLYSAIEEAKADVGGLFALQKLVDDGKIDAATGRSLYPTYLASMFRSIRFGIDEAHGKGTALQMSWFFDAGAVRVARDGTFSVDEPRMRAAVVALTRELMTLEARGDRAAAKALIERLAVVRPEVQRVLDRLRDVPVDIAPRFVSAEELTGR
jgi:hypothetical protein